MLENLLPLGAYVYDATFALAATYGLLLCPTIRQGINGLWINFCYLRLRLWRICMHLGQLLMLLAKMLPMHASPAFGFRSGGSTASRYLLLLVLLYVGKLGRLVLASPRPSIKVLAM